MMKISGCNSNNLLRFYACFILAYSLFSETSIRAEEPQDSPLPYEEKFSIRASMQMRYTELRIHAREDGAYGGASYSTNTPYRVGLSATYEGLGFTYHSHYLTIQQSEKYFGETEYTDMQLNYYSGQWGVESYFLDYQGHFKHTGETTFPWEKPSEPYYQRPDVQTVSYGGNLLYFESSKFSYKAAFQLTERQPFKSNDSHIWGISASKLKISADGTDRASSNGSEPNWSTLARCSARVRGEPRSGGRARALFRTGGRADDVRRRGRDGVLPLDGLRARESTGEVAPGGAQIPPAATSSDGGCANDVCGR